MILKNSENMPQEYSLYENLKEENALSTSIESSPIQNENLDDNDTTPNNEIKEIIKDTPKSNKGRITFFYHQLVVCITILILMFSLNTFTPKFYYDITNYLKKEICIKTDFKKDFENLYYIINHYINK